jgi:hypothetical protein
VGPRVVLRPAEVVARAVRPYAHGVIAVSGYVYLAIYWACLLMSAFALIDAVRHRGGIGVAADRQTKPIWLGLLAGGIVAQILFPPLSGGILSLLGLAGIVAAIVYLVDVRRRLVEVSRGPRW